MILRKSLGFGENEDEPKDKTTASKIPQDERGYSSDIDNVIFMLTKVNAMKEKNYITYDILCLLYRFCQEFSRFNLISENQLLKLCTINNEVIFKFAETTRIGKIYQDDGKYRVTLSKMKMPNPYLRLLDFRLTITMIS